MDGIINRFLYKVVKMNNVRGMLISQIGGKTMKKFWQWLLTACILVLALFAGCSEDKTKEAGVGEGKKLLIGCNNFLRGIYSLDILEKAFIATCNALDVEPYIVNDEGKTENSIANVDNMIAAGVDGVVFFGIQDPMFPIVAQKCDSAGIPFVFYDHMPSDAILEQCGQSKFYKGIAATVDLGTGQNIGNYALEASLKKAVVITGEQGDTTHTARTNGFSEVFKKGGGIVLAEAYGPTDLANALTRSVDTLTAHQDADCIYATNGDVGAAALEALAKHSNVKAKIFITDLDPSVLNGLQDGTVAAGNGAHWVNIDFATALLVSSLRGNDILDNGKAPRLVVPVMTLPSNLVGLYDKYWIQQHPYSDAEIRSLVGPGVTVDVYKKMLSEYNIINRLNAKVQQGLLTQADLDAALGR